MRREDIRVLFRESVERPEEKLDLAEAALLIAQAEYPHLDRGRYLRLLDKLATEAKRRVSDAMGPYGMVNTLSEYLFDGEGFRGNEDDYYDPRNSFLNDVLERKLGIPLTLSVVYIEVGRRLELPIVGVGMPGHFLVKYLAPEEEIIIDPFHRGIILSEEECADLLTRSSGEAIPFQPNYLAPVAKKQILTRMLNNLRSIYLSREDHHRALGIAERLLLVEPHDHRNVRDRGVLRLRVGDLKGALTDLETYLAASPNASDTNEIYRYAEAIRQRLGEQVS
ncbi:MAG: tetratricopeptide repeat protein [Chloroflexi bacterium]|nr:tetratricopeptide repeat protein [Chloroflexota bacterium]